MIGPRPLTLTDRGGGPEDRQSTCSKYLHRTGRSVRTSSVTFTIAVDVDVPSLLPTCPAFGGSLAERRRPMSPSIHCSEMATWSTATIYSSDNNQIPYFLYLCDQTSAAGAANKTKLRTAAQTHAAKGDRGAVRSIDIADRRIVRNAWKSDDAAYR